jgi:hypothetical protein
MYTVNQKPIAVHGDEGREAGTPADPIFSIRKVKKIDASGESIPHF